RLLQQGIHPGIAVAIEVPEQVAVKLGIEVLIGVDEAAPAQVRTLKVVFVDDRIDVLAPLQLAYLHLDAQRFERGLSDLSLGDLDGIRRDRKSTRLNSSHSQ